MTVQKIMINLDKDRDAYVVEDAGNMIHLREYDRIKELLADSLRQVKKNTKSDRDYEPESERRDDCRGGKEQTITRRHDTIMLAGVRGSGKTTFMLSLLYLIENGKMGLVVDGKNNAECDIETLKILDPTLIEDKTHIFVNIISMIKDKVDEKAKKSNCFKAEENDMSRRYKLWESAFRKLAEGIPAIDGVGADGFSTDSWLDAEFIMSKGVRMAHAANSLEKSFHEFVRLSLSFINKKAFILCFDDIDTNFGRGWPVLEILHKYLTTPQMITVLSGDPSLYSILIRDQQWGNFSDRLLKMETRSREGREIYKETVAHLEEQYFLKLLKPERRVFLNSLYQKELQDNLIFIQWKNTEPSSLREGYKKIFTSYGIHLAGEQEGFYRFLASMPLRTQKQLLYAYDSSTNEKKEFGNSIIDIFWSDLSEKKVDVSNLRNVPHYIVPQITDYLVRNKIILEGYTLAPLFADHFINGAQFALGTLLTERIKKDPAQIFEYWLRVCLTRELGTLLEGHDSEKGKGPSIEDYMDFCSITKLRSPRYVARISTAYMRACLGQRSSQRIINAKISDDKGTWHGTLPLLGLAEKAKVKREKRQGRIDAVFGEEDGFIKLMGYLPLSGFTNHKGQSRPIYSFYNLLGVLGEIVLTVQSSLGGDPAQAVRKVIAKNAQYREYSLPSWASALSRSSDNASDLIDDEDQEDSVSEQIPSDFADAIVNWVAQYENVSSVSPALLGKIFTRFYYAVNQMDGKLGKEPELGNWMHRMIVVFMNSVLIVEAMEQLELFDEKSNINVRAKLTNPTYKDDIFIDNLKSINAKIDEDKGKLKLSRWILSCPIWGLYIKKDFDCSITQDGVREFIAFTQQPLRPYELNELLDMITINVYEIKKSSKQEEVVTVNKLIHTTKQLADSPLPSFTVYSTDCRNKLLNIFSANGLSIDDIVKLAPDLRLMLINWFAKQYNPRSITENTVRGIITRLVDGRWTL